MLTKALGAPRSEVAPLFSNIVSLPGIECENKSALLSALDFWERNSPLDFGDCYRVALGKPLGIGRMYTFDEKMDRYPGVERVEP